MTRLDYEALKKMGMLWEFYPECTGTWEDDWRLWYDGPYKDDCK